MLKLKNISTSEKNPLLKNLNLNLSPGELIHLTYKSSFEKNKLIDLICKVELPKSGEVHTKEFGISFENFKLISSKNTIENVIFPLQIKTTLKRSELLKKGEKHLKMFGLLNKKETLTSRLSLAEKQRLNIARALIIESEFIILDNPFKHFTEDQVNGFIVYIDELNSKGKTILILSNNKALDQITNKKTYILEKGEILNV